MNAAISFPPDLIAAIATAVADELDRRDGRSTMVDSPWRDVDEAANYLRCARQRVYDLVHEGRLEPARDGRRLLFHRDALDAYLRSGDRS